MLKFKVGDRVRRPAEISEDKGTVTEVPYEGSGYTCYVVNVDGEGIECWHPDRIEPDRLMRDQITAVLQTAGMTADQTSRFWNNFKERDLVGVFKNAKSRPQDYVICAFLWNSTPEGQAYWSAIYNRLTAR